MPFHSSTSVRGTRVSVPYHVGQLTSAGAPIQLDDFVALLSLPSASPTGEEEGSSGAPTITQDAVYLPTDQTFPLLQFAEHPITGQGCWSVHPCHVAEAVDELLQHNGQTWLETWLMLSGAIVDLT